MLETAASIPRNCIVTEANPARRKRRARGRADRERHARDGAKGVK
jgi:hypothetical protein